MRVILESPTTLRLICESFDDAEALRLAASQPLTFDLYDAQTVCLGEIVIRPADSTRERDGLHMPDRPGRRYLLLLPQTAIDSFAAIYHWRGRLSDGTACTIYYPFYE